MWTSSDLVVAGRRGSPGRERVGGQVRLAAILAVASVLLPAIAVARHAVRAGRRWGSEARP